MSRTINPPEQHRSLVLLDEQAQSALERSIPRRLVKHAARCVVLTRREGLSAVPSRLWARSGRRVLDSLRWRCRRTQPWIADDRPVFLLVHHGGGGGIARHVRDLAEGLYSAGVRPVLLAPGPGASLRWEEWLPDESYSWSHGTGSRREEVSAALALLRPVHAHVHSAMGLSASLLGLLAERGVEYDWTVHDYYSVCPRAHLNRNDGPYCGEPDENGCAACLARWGDDRGRPFSGSISAWRREQGRLLKGARRVFVPSEDTRRRLVRYFPGLAVIVRPHLEGSTRSIPTVVPYEDGRRLKVAVLGTLTAPKGSALLQACAEDASHNERPMEFVVLGRTDRDAILARTRRVVLTGPYREDDVAERLGRLQCHLAFFPSVVPETYMYTLSIAIRAGLFAVCLDLGAQAERVRSSGYGLVLARDASPVAINEALLQAALRRPVPVRPSPMMAPAEKVDLLGDYYGFTDAEHRRFAIRVTG